MMQRISILLLVLVVCFATAMQAQAPAPKVGPEVKKLHAAVGHWTIEGEDKPGPLGPGGKFTGEMTCRMILGGSFLQCQVSEKLAEGEMQFLEIDGYDPVNKNFSTAGYFGGGGGWSGVITIAGNTWTYGETKMVIAGKQYQYKGTFAFAPDLASATYKDELSADGTTWALWTDSKWTKVQPAAKK